MKNILGIAFFTLFITTQSLAAESQAELVAQMNSLIQAGRYEEAYVLAQSGLFDYEGETNFDFAYGLAALESGRPDEAVFAFERVAFNNPNQQRVKLELARAYFLSENYAASATLFNEVLASNPTPNVRNNVEAFLILIEQAQSANRSVLTFDVGYNTGYDTNINSATELGVIDTPIGDVILSQGGQQINNHYREFVGNVRYVRPIDNNSNFAVQGNYRNRNNLDSDQFDLDIGFVQFGYNHGLNQRLRYNHALRVQSVRLDSSSFQKSYTLLNTVRRIGDNGWSQSLTGAYTGVRYANGSNQNASLRDINQVLASGVVSKGTNRNLISGSLYYGVDRILREVAKNNATTFYGIAVSDQMLVFPEHLAYVRASYQENKHQARDPIFVVERRNDLFSLSLGWIWQPVRRLSVTADYTFTDNESNIALYTYDRRRFQAGVSLQF